MQKLFDAFFQLPEYVAELLTGPYLVWVVLALFVFLIAMFFNGRIGHGLRQICILALAICSVIAYFKRQYKLFWLLIVALAVLLLYRLLVYACITIRQNHINRRIEKKALEKAEMRRGARKRDFGPENSASEAVRAESPAEERQSGEQQETSGTEDAADGTLSRTQLFDSLSKLEDLKNTGALTEEEFNQKKAELYARLG